jgi:hypothetical protein
MEKFKDFRSKAGEFAASSKGKFEGTKNKGSIIGNVLTKFHW